MDQDNTLTIYAPETQIIDPAMLERAGRVANEFAMQRTIDDYLKRKAQETRRRQAAGLALFARYLDDAGDLGAAMRAFAEAVRDYPDAQPDAEVWRGVSWGIVQAFVEWQLREGYAVGTVNVRLSTVKVYAKLAHQAGIIEIDEYNRVKGVKGYSTKEIKRVDEVRAESRRGPKKAAPVRLTHEQAAALKAHDATPQGRRDALLMCLLLDHGLRCGEIAGLRVEHFDLEAGEMIFYRPKVDRTQTHKLSAGTLRAAQAYFEHDAPEGGALLRGSRKGGELTDNCMSTRSITARVRALGERAGVQGLSAHDCRHYWATANAHHGLLRLQEAGGWSSFEMPRHYVEVARVANEGMV